MPKNDRKENAKRREIKGQNNLDGQNIIQNCNQDCLIPPKYLSVTLKLHMAFIGKMNGTLTDSTLLKVL